jgi:hypothetical protein
MRLYELFTRTLATISNLTLLPGGKNGLSSGVTAASIDASVAAHVTCSGMRRAT